MINISVYIFIYIYYTIKFLLCVTAALLIYLSVFRKDGWRETWRRWKEIYSHQTTKSNCYGNHYHVGGGERTDFHTWPQNGSCEHLWLCYKLGIPLQSVETDLSIVFSLSACISTNYRSSPLPALPCCFCFNLWGFSFPFHTIWVNGQGQYLLSETNSSDKTGPKPVCSRFEWQTLKLDLGDPLFK